MLWFIYYTRFCLYNSSLFFHFNKEYINTIIFNKSIEKLFLLIMTRNTRSNSRTNKQTSTSNSHQAPTTPTSSSSTTTENSSLPSNQLALLNDSRNKNKRRRFVQSGIYNLEVDTQNLQSNQDENSDVFNQTLKNIQSQIYSSKRNIFSASEEQKKTWLNSVDQLNKQALNKEFKKLLIKINGKETPKSPIYRFFHFKDEINKDENINFVCIVCFKIYNENISESSNLTQHLRKHNTETDTRLNTWLTAWHTFKRDSEKNSNFNFPLESKLKYF